MHQVKPHILTMLLVHYFRFRLRHKSALPMYPMTLHNQLMEIFQHIRWYSLALDYSVYRIVQHAWLSRTMRFQRTSSQCSTSSCACPFGAVSVALRPSSCIGAVPGKMKALGWTLGVDKHSISVFSISTPHCSNSSICSKQQRSSIYFHKWR